MLYALFSDPEKEFPEKRFEGAHMEMLSILSENPIDRPPCPFYYHERRQLMCEEIAIVCLSRAFENVYSKEKPHLQILELLRSAHNEFEKKFETSKCEYACPRLEESGNILQKEMQLAKESLDKYQPEHEATPHLRLFGNNNV